MNDLLNFIKPKKDQFMTATFYPRRPILTSDVGIKFRYKKLDPKRQTFEQPLPNVYTEGSVTAISTNAALPFVVGAYVYLQDGGLYTRTEIGTHENNEAVHLMFKNCIDDEIVLRLLEVENEHELEDDGV